MPSRSLSTEHENSCEGFEPALCASSVKKNIVLIFSFSFASAVEIKWILFKLNNSGQMFLYSFSDFLKVIIL
ncbi:hypothetical protein Lsan_3742 [Legionella santicrucis]|uniref:Uncharacterized protein n=1 Tax=Legionella santicrucis TaxID=45074 RepID=A0A0W0Y9Q7_9GAMM|nr:hypothetical protein Lsan_3742 [Legionella santicrucis]